MNKIHNAYNARPILENNMNIFTPDEAFIAGTLFKMLYEPYKNYKFTALENKTEKEKMMIEVQKYGIVVHDLDLYLDVYPNDENALRLRKKYSQIYESMINKYEEAYSPITLSSDKVNTLPFPWSTSVFPWGDE